MPLTLKPDWDETKARFETWWDHGYFGRCGLSVTAPLDRPPAVPEPPPARDPHQKWFDLDWISRDRAYRLSRRFYGGEAFPVWNAGYAGVSALPAILGCPTDIDLDTGWWNPVLNDPAVLDVGHLVLDPGQPNYAFTVQMLERAARESMGRSIPSIGAFGGSGDTLAALRGTERLLFDCIERPQAVRAAEELLMDMWIDFYSRCHALIRDAAEGSTCWFGLWSPGKFYAAQNDFSYNIGPDMFRELFLPVVRRQTEYLDHAVYHVDGVEAFRHVDALCELPRLQAIQVLPGAGKPGPLHYRDVLRTVQRAGKNLHISIPAAEVEEALEILSARGLFIDTQARTETEARELLALARRNSVDRG